jgi:hypothetical protein
MFSHGAFEVLDEDVEPFGGGGPLGLLRGELIGCPADLLDGGVYLVSGGFLLLSGEDGVVQHGSCRGHQLADLAGLAGALLGSHDRGVRLVPHPGDDHRNRLGGVHRALGELADLGGDDGEPLARLAGPGGLDGGVQREQVRLRGDVVDQLQDVADLLRALAEGQRPRGDRLDLVLHVAHRVAGQLGGLRHRVRVVGDRPGGGGQLHDGRRCLRHRRGLLARHRGCVPRRLPQLAGDVYQDRRGRADAAQEVVTVAQPPERRRQLLLSPEGKAEQPDREERERDAGRKGEDGGRDTDGERLTLG